MHYACEAIIVDSQNDRNSADCSQEWLLRDTSFPIIYLTTPILDAAGYYLPDAVTAAGAGLELPALWLFWRSHADLGRHWSPGLEV